ncbi:hypothetical protein AMTR_s00003p00269750 [Amborella trichopoda]|uniref:Uncharacterized protein n=1 Tax=Amborella trichopoda TaxID=13333 RepID=W1P732_AMBTC|nr:hypothetical protein AMTR_s00003p00269750 [Amborella trichopoda]
MFYCVLIINMNHHGKKEAHFMKGTFLDSSNHASPCLTQKDATWLPFREAEGSASSCAVGHPNVRPMRSIPWLMKLNYSLMTLKQEIIEK